MATQQEEGKQKYARRPERVVGSDRIQGGSAIEILDAPLPKTTVGVQNDGILIPFESNVTE